MSRRDQVVDALVRKHPLQWLDSPSRGVSAFVHILGLASFAASFKYLLDNPNPANDSYGWHFQYLTIIGLSLAALTFVFGIVADVTLSRNAFLVKNALSFCSAPLEILISLLYWGLRVINKDLVLPDWAQLDTSVDLGFHAIPAIMLAVDLLFLSPPWTLGALPAIAISTILAFAYWFWIETCYAYNGWYPYPIFELVDTKGRIALFVGSAVMMTLNAAMLQYVYARVNGTGIIDVKKTKAHVAAVKK